MANRSRHDDVAALPAPPDEGSRIRESAAGPANAEIQATLSLDQRLAQKLRIAEALLLKLEPQDARARLLHIAMLRRDEALLDGILAELACSSRAR